MWISSIVFNFWAIFCVFFNSPWSNCYKLCFLDPDLHLKGWWIRIHKKMNADPQTTTLLEREYEIFLNRRELLYCNKHQHFLAFSWASFKNNLTPRRLTLRSRIFELKIRLSSRKRIFQQNHFSLFIRGPGGLDNGHPSLPNMSMRRPTTSVYTWAVAEKGFFFSVTKCQSGESTTLVGASDSF